MALNRLNFQSPEHRRIGDQLVLRFPDGSISGTHFSYAGPKFPGDLTLSYGQIVALAGDFYGNCKIAGDAEQISDQWRSNPEASIKRFMLNTDLLNEDTKGYLKKVVDIMKDQEAEIKNIVQNGEDVAQAFKRTGDQYDTRWAKATDLDYLWLALCNWDHFGQDAVSAYSAGHTAALRQAKAARETNNEVGLRYAYFLEAFASHFLTDLFSSGHMRTPRRVLHQTYFGDLPVGSLEKTVETKGYAALKIQLWPADECAHNMHDEDCANGLWVTNAKGTSWPAYGDSQLFSSKENLDFNVVLDAVQTGVNEVWQMFQDGEDRPVEKFEALKKVPILGNMKPPNYAPLFKTDGTTLYFRSSIDNRCLSTYDPYPLSDVPWNQILQRISDSGESKNQLPLTLLLLSPSKLLHLREIDELDELTFSVADYGTVYSESATTEATSVESWNMNKQRMLSIPQSSGKTTWNSADKIDDCVYSLVGRILLSSSSTNAYHVGLRLTDDQVKVLWADEVEDDNKAWVAGTVLYGRFDADRDTLAMIKHWHKPASPWKSKLELWTFTGGTQEAPVRKNTEWPSDFELPPCTAFGIRLDAQDTSDTFVTAALDESTFTAKTLWTFSTWKNDYADLTYSTCNETLSERAQTTVVRNATNTKANRVIRLFYGEKYSKAGYVRIDVLLLSKSSITTISSSQFPITWPGIKEEYYLTWFLSDVDADGKEELVGLVTDDGGGLTVLVFKPKSDESAGFEDPVTSSITSDKGILFTAPFMIPILARQAQYKFPGTSYKVDSGIMIAFDNYGVLGVRMVRPKSYSGTLEYEIGGQVPALSGQVSATLGWATRLFKVAREAIGLFILSD